MHNIPDEAIGVPSLNVSEAVKLVSTSATNTSRLLPLKESFLIDNNKGNYFHPLGNILPDEEMYSDENNIRRRKKENIGNRLPDNMFVKGNSRHRG